RLRTGTAPVRSLHLFCPPHGARHLCATNPPLQCWSRSTSRCKVSPRIAAARCVDLRRISAGRPQRRKSFFVRETNVAESSRERAQPSRSVREFCTAIRTVIGVTVALSKGLVPSNTHSEGRLYVEPSRVAIRTPGRRRGGLVSFRHDRKLPRRHPRAIELWRVDQSDCLRESEAWQPRQRMGCQRIGRRVDSG